MVIGLLAARQGEVVSKDEILGVVWPGRVVEESNLNVQIAKLRRISITTEKRAAVSRRYRDAATASSRRWSGPMAKRHLLSQQFPKVAGIRGRACRPSCCPSPISTAMSCRRSLRYGACRQAPPARSALSP
jgi:hypothetical protein